MSKSNTYEKAQNILSAYVPEFRYEENGNDAGSVLTKLCVDMMEDCALRYDRILPKHKIQYLNMLDFIKNDPVSASKGYVQFHPVIGYENGDIPVPAHTQVMCSTNTDEIIFETQHDMTVTPAVPQIAVMTDLEKDCICVEDISKNAEKATFRAFDVSGNNCAAHRMYLCFEHIFDYVNNLNFNLFIEARTKDNQEIQMKTIKDLTEKGSRWFVLNSDLDEIPFDVVSVRQDHIHFEKKDFLPEKAVVGHKEGYYLVVEAGALLPDIYLDIINITIDNAELPPDEIYINNTSENIGNVLPFGKPLGLYNEMKIESKEVFSKKGADIVLEFDLDYVLHEETFEMEEVDTEYKTIMKKPKKAAGLRSEEVHADYVVWEYLSTYGWKRLLKEEYQASMFNGTLNGKQRIEFVLPEDIADYEEGMTDGRIRIQLLRAENIYKIPVVYVCPRITSLKLSYSYSNRRFADYAFTQNNFEVKDVTKALSMSESVRPFYSTEHELRTMYLGFDSSIAGSPVSLYFDVENFSDRAIDFTVEYMSEKGFRRIKVIDSTDGLLGSGNILMLLPKDMKKTNLYGYEGYFIRFVNYNPVHYEYALPVIHGMYMNMAKVANVNVKEEVFYLDRTDGDLDIQLSQGNLLQVQLWVKEKIMDGEKWVLWDAADKISVNARTYQIDLLLGKVHISKQILMNIQLGDNDAQIKIRHSSYTGSKANLEAGRINVLRNAVSYITGVSNPFPTYGGYDGYTEESASKLVASMLRTRNRAVTQQDYLDIISQTSYGIRKVKCITDIDLFGKPAPGIVTIAVLIDEYEKGVHIFSELKDSIRKKLEETSGLFPMGKKIVLTQPHFIKLNVRVWIERDTMEQAFDIQTKAYKIIWDFIDPINGGCHQGREIGEFPRASQIIAALRSNILDCSISKIVLTAVIDGEEIPVSEEFYRQYNSPFIMAINGEHIVYVELK